MQEKVLSTIWQQYLMKIVSNTLRRQLPRVINDQISSFHRKQPIMTLGEWLDCWLSEYKEDTVRPGTLRSYRTIIEQYLKPQLGEKQISLITPQDIQRMYHRLKKEGRANEHPEKGTQLADNTVRGIHCTLHLAMERLEKSRAFTSAELGSVFGSGYAGKRNAVLYAAIENQMDFLLFLDDDEYPMKQWIPGGALWNWKRKQTICLSRLRSKSRHTRSTPTVWIPFLS